MPKFLVWELTEVTAEDADAAADSVTKGKKKSVAFAAPTLRELVHPGHLQKTLDMFGDTFNAPRDEI